METSWNTALWRQFDIAIDTLEEALVACPDSLWIQRLWRVPRRTPYHRGSPSSGTSRLLARLVSHRLPGGGIRSPRTLLPGLSLTPHGCCQHGPIRRRNCLSILCLRVRGARLRWLRWRTNGRARSLSTPGLRGRQSATWSYRCTICVTCRNMRPNCTFSSDRMPSLPCPTRSRGRGMKLAAQS